MSYYEYEFRVLKTLSEMLKIESTNIASEIYEAIKTTRNEQGILENIIVNRYSSDDVIRLNFANDFRFEFSREILKDAYIQEYPSSFIARQIKNDICEEYVNAFLEKKKAT